MGHEPHARPQNDSKEPVAQRIDRALRNELRPAAWKWLFVTWGLILICLIVLVVAINDGLRLRLFATWLYGFSLMWTGAFFIMMLIWLETLLRRYSRPQWRRVFARAGVVLFAAGGVCMSLGSVGWGEFGWPTTSLVGVGAGLLIVAFVCTGIGGFDMEMR